MSRKRAKERVRLREAGVFCRCRRAVAQTPGPMMSHRRYRKAARAAWVRFNKWFD